MSDETRIDLSQVRRRLDGARGRVFWKSLDELAETPGFLEFLRREFPEQASELNDPAGRREFLRLMGASLALAGLTACTRQPEEKIVPYVKQPEEIVPGRPLFFATAVTDGGYAKGVLVESHMGRPTKIEGNPDHPESLGATDVFGQAAVLGLYDPDRSQTLTQLGEIRAWGAFLAAVKTALAGQRPMKGAGFRILTETVTSPTLARQIEDLLVEFPAAKWHQYEPVNRDSARAGAILALGEPVETQYRLEKADVILSLEADFVSSSPASLRLIREFTRRRKVSGEGGGEHGSEPAAADAMNRLYVVEGSPTLTGALADHRLPLRSGEIEGFTRAVAATLGLSVEGGSGHSWIAPLVKDLQGSAGRCVVIPGEFQPPAVHALAHAMNERLGNVGKTVVYTAPVPARSADEAASLRELVEDMDAGKVGLLLLLGGNPVYTAPADLRFGERLDKVPVRIHLGLYDDETAERCHWHIPETHSLEAWSDARAADGTVTILQPLIAPLYQGAKSAHEVLAAFTNRPERSGYDVVRDQWKAHAVLAPGEKEAAFERFWEHALHDGVVPGSALPEKTVTVKTGEWARPTAGSGATAGLEVIFRPDPSIGDGRYANNGWLQELPKPLTKLTWGNAALMGPMTAQRLGIALPEATSLGSFTDVVELKYKERKVKAPVWIVPGHVEGAVTVHLGNGRRKTGRAGRIAGFNAYSIRTSDAPWFGSGLEVVRLPDPRRRIACTQDHWSIEAQEQAERRHLVRTATLEEYRKDPEVLRKMGEEPGREATLYPPFEYKGHAWGMTIDLNSCVGCNACMVACQAENNIPVVGWDQVGRGREMHWIRIDRYYGGDPGKAETIETHHQPVLCMHCENAPCEVVCPVAATVHSDEGLNDMVYNRCVGTRYCSNNCPYKVRRFNFFLYQDWETPTFKMLRNPDVSVRSRGVMEKCTYCVQRINQARIDSKNEGREIRDGEIRTACQQACPGEAIVFGDINDPSSEVARLKKQPRNYGLLADLNTHPRTTYLASVRNPNPEMPHV